MHSFQVFLILQELLLGYRQITNLVNYKKLSKKDHSVISPMVKQDIKARNTWVRGFVPER